MARRDVPTIVEFEDAGLLDTQYEIAVNERYLGGRNSRLDVDYIRLVVEEGETYIINGVLSWRYPLAFQLLDSEGSQIDRSDSFAGGRTGFLTFTAEADEVYYVRPLYGGSGTWGQRWSITLLQPAFSGKPGGEVTYGSAEGEFIMSMEGSDIIHGGAGNDTIDSGYSGGNTVYGNDGDDVIGSYGYANRLSGGRGNDLVVANSSDTCFGGEGDDTIYGAGENYSGNYRSYQDNIFLGPGNDKAYGLRGDDFISGASGDDLVLGNHGADTLTGGSGNDRVYGHTENDRLDGGAGNDLLSGGDHKDILTGRTGNDTLKGGNHDDRLYGGVGDDLVAGNDGRDAVNGGSGNDRIFGGRGADTLQGNNGDDTLNGGTSSDVLTGGLGADVFVYRNSNESYDNLSDLITDFQVGIDSVDLTLMSDDLIFVREFSGSAGEVRYDEIASRLLIDFTGNGIEDFAIDFSAGTTIDETDLVM
ncbi:calcium-binding protein [uncultured Pelagimonas sp.]|uniref:calcium-binding protein n=1 Tax=uncultured Pelagimonas sp. TaxID=1618102 RepID=UPI00261513A9|nr:calcium-binding protein [uncultured Pelagimonas sp.]